jgi:hypothetical protein
MSTEPIDEATARSLYDEVYIKASNADLSDNFGSVVAVSGDTLVVGAARESSKFGGAPSDNSLGSAGAAYVYVRQGNAWIEQARLKASNADSNDFFGSSVALSGDRIVVGAPGEDSAATGVDGDASSNTAYTAGAAYVFERSGSSWTQVAYLKASNARASANFGGAVALAGDTVVVGSPDESSSATGVDGSQTDTKAEGAGAVYVFVRSGSTWSQQAYLKASNARSRARFGTSLAMAGETLAVGAPAEDSAGSGIDGDQSRSTNGQRYGAAYVFVRSGSSWSQQVFLKGAAPDNALSAAQSLDFGRALALSGSTLVVGAPADSSGARGIDGDVSMGHANRSGAAYIYVRDATQVWSQQAYVKSPTALAGDEFGSSVGIDGDRVAIGSPGAPRAKGYGRVHVLGRQGDTWGELGYYRGADQQGKLDPGARFGAAVSIASELLAVGAPLDASDARGLQGDRCDVSASRAGSVYVGRY